MTSSLIEERDRRAVVITGLLLGVAPVVFGTAWATTISVFVLWTYLGKPEKRLSLGDFVRLGTAWLLAMMVCDVLMHGGAFKEGFVTGWNAGSYWHPKA